jgi:hypothetical protein
VREDAVSGRGAGALNVLVERGPAAELKAHRHLSLASPVTGSGGHPSHPSTKEHTVPEENVVKTLNYQELRKAVECAASYRDQQVYLVVDDEGWSVLEQPPKDPAGKAVIPVNSPGKPGGPKTLELAQIGLYKDKPVDLLKLQVHGKEEQADAVFWTPAAVEKFLVPYYASVYGDQAPKKLTDLIDVLGTVRTDLAGVQPAAHTPLADSTAFAGAHMPKSEYVQVDGGMAVLVHTPTGAVAISLSDYVAGKP